MGLNALLLSQPLVINCQSPSMEIALKQYLEKNLRNTLHTFDNKLISWVKGSRNLSHPYFFRSAVLAIPSSWIFLVVERNIGRMLPRT